MSRLLLNADSASKVARLGFRICEAGISHPGRLYTNGEKFDWKDWVRTNWCILKYR